MKSRARQVGVGLALAFAAASGAADQNDPRLPELFAALRTAGDAEVAAATEKSIWRVWSRSGDERGDALYRAGVAAMAHGDLDSALAHFERLVELLPDFAEAWNKLATVRYLRGEYAASMRDIQRTLELEPRHFGALSGIGLIFQDTGDYEGASRAFREVLRIHPHARGARRNLERIEQRRGGRAISPTSRGSRAGARWQPGAVMAGPTPSR